MHCTMQEDHMALPSVKRRSAMWRSCRSHAVYQTNSVGSACADCADATGVPERHDDRRSCVQRASERRHHDVDDDDVLRLPLRRPSLSPRMAGAEYPHSLVTVGLWVLSSSRPSGLYQACTASRLSSSANITDSDAIAISRELALPPPSFSIEAQPGTLHSGSSLLGQPSTRCHQHASRSDYSSRRAGGINFQPPLLCCCKTRSPSLHA